MKNADLTSQENMFYSLINEIEKEYYIYFGLKAIQKSLETERIYDHFILDSTTGQLNFLTNSDLPQEIREVILSAYQKIFSPIKALYK